LADIFASAAASTLIVGAILDAEADGGVFSVIPSLQRREVGGYSFFLIWVMRIGDLEFVENIHQ
jgi:hypothetical protein